jgi:hypothetical protein
VGTARMPAGGVATGAGGTAAAPGRSSAAWPVWWLALPLAAAAAVGIARRGRRVRRHARTR